MMEPIQTKKLLIRQINAMRVNINMMYDAVQSDDPESSMAYHDEVRFDLTEIKELLTKWD